jgi:hypothetical protein
MLALRHVAEFGLSELEGGAVRATAASLTVAIDTG